MTKAHTRRKDPARVRQALIDGTAALVVEHGLSNVTVASVAASAGVTKGALFHHFADRDALVAAMLDMLLKQIDNRLESLMAADPDAHGRFTRAYVNAALAPSEDDRHIWAALTGALVSDNDLTRRWYQWISERLAAFPSEHDPMLEIVRLAADGAWLGAITGVASIDLASLQARLIDLTRPPVMVEAGEARAATPL